jgi:hypothetical protein
MAKHFKMATQAWKKVGPDAAGAGSNPFGELAGCSPGLLPSRWTMPSPGVFLFRARAYAASAETRFAANVGFIGFNRAGHFGRGSRFRRHGK